MLFIPNQGKLISADDTAEVAIWDLRDIMVDPIRLEMPLTDEGDLTSKITGLYTPMMLSTEQANH
jgi:hypothetical protein